MRIIIFILFRSIHANYSLVVQSLSKRKYLVVQLRAISRSFEKIHSLECNDEATRLELSHISRTRIYSSSRLTVIWSFIINLVVYINANVQSRMCCRNKNRCLDQNQWCNKDTSGTDTSVVAGLWGEPIGDVDRPVKVEGHKERGRKSSKLVEILSLNRSESERL